MNGYKLENVASSWVNDISFVISSRVRRLWVYTSHPENANRLIQPSQLGTNQITFTKDQGMERKGMWPSSAPR